MRISETTQSLSVGRKSGPTKTETEAKPEGRAIMRPDAFVRTAPAASTAVEPASPSDSKPQPLLHEVGGTNYYVARAEDFRRRHPDLPVPTYYMGYGDKYVHRFTEELNPKLSPEGQEWLAKARVNLQMAFENELKKDPAAFDKLERDDAAFLEFAYESHPKAYLDAGLEKLPLKDLIRVGLTPDVRDIATTNGMEQVADVAVGLAAKRARMYLDKGLTWKLPAEKAE